ncbi:N-terminal phage integrase SAM-like domain-containing protein [Streptomyces sp. A012304]|uniref:N-terminal phage integrase SAM-like domain-containing protein n=1 Tax=Streptomyces sp. A012304 TaxID=375446 RepID=UPI0022327904|nr:N-terminal phage integrase SAM-like domain-containing protein [Streptomyces sp. A012304]
MPSVEARGNSIRVKWWGGEYHLDADGKPTKRKKYESASGPEPGVPFQDEDEAYKFGLDRESDVRNNRHRPKSVEMNMVEYCDIWFSSLDLRTRTMDKYESILNAVIKPYWRHWTVGQITPVEYDRFKSFVGKKYSELYKRGVLSVFRMLMDDAVLKYKLRDETPVIDQRHRGRYEKKLTRRAKSELPIEAVHQLAVNAYHVFGYSGWSYIWTIAFTGMRPPGETQGLQRGFTSVHWPASDPDRDRRKEARRYDGMHVLRVQHQTYYSGGKAVLAAPKYDSHRSLVIPPFLHEQHEALLASHDKPWLFISQTGKHLLSVGFTKNYWYPIRDGREERKPRPGYERYAHAALPAVEEMAGQDIYRLRHWHKALLDEPGADIADVAKEARMGHEMPGMAGVYSEVTLAMERRVVEYLQGVWEKRVVAAGLWMPPFPIGLPDDLLEGSFSLFSGLPSLELK